MKTLSSILNQDQLQYVEDVSPAEISLRLISGTTNGVAVVACAEMAGADLRFPSDPTLPFYMWQNLGGCIADSLGLDVIVADKDINDIVVFGHTDCGIIKTGLCGVNSDRFSEEIYTQLCEKTEQTRVATKDRFGDKFDGEVQIKATRDFVLRQVASLLNIDLIRKRAENGLLRIHSWILNSETSEIESFNPSTREFAVLSQFWSQR